MIDKNLKIYDSVCTGCSACTEACNFPDENGTMPIKLIKNKNGLNVPRIDSNICTECMMCYKACPTEDKIFNNDITFEQYKENIGNCYYGYSLDTNHRYEASTAGVVTEIATYLLESKRVDGVLSTYQTDNNEIVTEIFTDSKKIKGIKGSIYRQVPLLNGFLEKIKEKNIKKLLVIGLPCHILGIKNLYKTNRYLKKNVEIITIALFCKQTKTEEFSDFERKMLGITGKVKINYRGKGWPGLTTIENKTIPSTNVKLSFMWSNFIFTPNYCFTCSDPLGLEADISVGDAWLHKYYNDNQGSSLFIANTILGKKIIEEMSNTNLIFSTDETAENIILSQNKQAIKYKTTNIKYRNFLFGKGDKDKLNDRKYKILSLLIILNKKIFEKIYRKGIILYIPNILLKIYLKVYGLIKKGLG